MSLYKRGRIYWSKLYAGGLVHRFSTGARTKVEALSKERVEADRLKRLFKAESNRSVGTLAALFLENTEAANRADETRKKMEQHLITQIIPFLGADRDASTISNRDLEDFKARRIKSVAAVTVCKELSTFRQMIRFAGETLKLFPPGETPTTRNPKLSKYEPRWTLLTEVQLGALVTELAKQSRKGREAVSYFLLMMNTGMRGGEQSKIERSWIDLDRREIHLPAWATKTRRARDVPLNDSALAAVLVALERAPEVGRIFRYRTHYRAWHRAVRAAGLATIPAPPVPTKRPTSSGVRPHDLRHSYGSLLYLGGTSTPEVRDILGHVTLMMANLYAHTFRERLHVAVNAMNVGQPVPKTVPLLNQNVPEKVTNGQPMERTKPPTSATRKR